MLLTNCDTREMQGAIMKKLLTTLFGLMAISAFQIANAVPITLTFDGNLAPVPSYTENGMTITTGVGSTSQFQISGGRWNVPCCPGPQYDMYELTTGGVFDLLSLYIWHSDPGDPIVFEGFFDGSSIVSAVVNAGNFGLFNFAGFSSLDMVRVSVTGRFTDPTFDNLVYESVPEPGTLGLLGLGLCALGMAKRKTIQ